jgi:hypothetical protein
VLGIEVGHLLSGDRGPVAGAPPWPVQPPRAPANRPQKPRSHRWGRRLRVAAWVAGGVLLVLAGLVGWVAADAVRVRGDLQRAASGVAALQADVIAGETDDVGRTVADLQSHAANARGATEGAHWSIVGRLPVVGPTVVAVADMSDVVAGLAQGPLPQLADVVAVADPATLVPEGGRVDLAPLQEVAPAVERADRSVGYAQERVAGIGGSPMLPQVSDAVAALSGQLADLRMSTATASRAAQLLPPMLGADGARDYLVLVQNNAEPRALGGITGTVLVLRADEGRIELTDQRPGSQVGSFDQPVVELTDDERRVLGGADLGRWMQNVTATPDFPRSAQIAREMWRRETGQTVDGVLAADPVLLAGLLDTVDTGPGGVLRGDALVAYLLNGVYLTESPERQNEIFAQTARAAFADLSSGAGEPAGMVDALAVAAREGRLSVWSSVAAEAELLEGTVLDGALRGVNGDHPVVGVFTQGIQMAKIGWYVDTQVRVAERGTRPDGSRDLAVVVTYTSRVDAGQAEHLPEYVVGRGETSPGAIRLRSLVYAPAGGHIVSASENSQNIGLSPQKHDGLWLSFHDLELMPGATSSVTYAIITGKHQDGDVILRTTPGPRPVRMSGKE